MEAQLKCFFIAEKKSPQDNATLGQRIPWNLLQTIAIIQLYVEERWIEPPAIPRLPFSLLYHQTMSTLLAHTELKPPALAQRVLSLSPFKNVSQTQYRDLLRFLIELRHIEQTEIGGLIIGLEGEKIVNNFRFYATFQDEIAFQVREGSREIGTIQALPNPNDTIALAGFSWKVLEVHQDKQIIYVERVKGRAPALWLGGGSFLHQRVLKRMLQILQESSTYGYLQDRAKLRLKEVRELAQMAKMTTQNILTLGGHRFMILPWTGTSTFETIAILLQPHVRVSTVYKPFYLEIEHPDADVTDLQELIDTICASAPSDMEIAKQLKRSDIEKSKYDRFIPDSLLCDAIASDYLDVKGAIDILRNLKITHE